MRDAAEGRHRPVGAQIAAAAREWVGTPFVWEASLKGVGADCRGVLAGAARDCGRAEAAEFEARVAGYSRRIDEDALRAGLDRLFDPVPVDADLRLGDVLGFRIQHRMQHLAICTGDGGECGGAPMMVHAYSGTPHQVVETPIGGFWMRRLAGVWRWRERGARGGD